MTSSLSSGASDHSAAPTSEIAKVHLLRIRRYCQWIVDRLIVRHDAYVSYRMGGKRKVTGLTVGDLIFHAAGVQPLALYGIGQLGTNNANKCKWVAWDLDNHEGLDETRLRNTDYAIELASALRQLGFDPLIESSDGRGGYHIWMFFDSDVPTQVAHSFAQWAVKELCDWSAFLTEPPECYPKHDSLSEQRQYSMALRVPGRHPKHQGVWSSVISRHDERWVTWPDAIDEIVSYTGTSVDLIPKGAHTYKAPAKRRNTQERVDRSVMSNLLGPPLATSDPSSPGDFFNRTMAWEDVLEPHGWEVVRYDGDVTYWRRPDKYDDGHSATTGYCGDKMYVFSSAVAGLEQGQVYSKFDVHAIVDYGGDYEAAEIAILYQHDNNKKEE